MTGVRFPAEVTNVSLLHTFQTGSRVYLAYHPMLSAVLSQRVKREGHETEHLLSHSAEVRNADGVALN
jgi:hypothetical protein